MKRKTFLITIIGFVVLGLSFYSKAKANNTAGAIGATTTEDFGVSNSSRDSMGSLTAESNSSRHAGTYNSRSGGFVTGQ